MINLRRLLVDRARTLSTGSDMLAMRKSRYGVLFTDNYYHLCASRELFADWPEIIWC